jgi:UrcA family protein
MTIQTIITKTALIFAATLSTAALASEGNQRRVEIRASGIDVTQDAGIKLLTERARVAARSVCATAGTVSLDALRASTTCYKTAIASAEAQIEALRLRAMERGGRVTASAETNTPPTMSVFK